MANVSDFKDFEWNDSQFDKDIKAIAREGTYNKLYDLYRKSPEEFCLNLDKYIHLFIKHSMFSYISTIFNIADKYGFTVNIKFEQLIYAKNFIYLYLVNRFKWDANDYNNYADIARKSQMYPRILKTLFKLYGYEMNNYYIIRQILEEHREIRQYAKFLQEIISQLEYLPKDIIDTITTLNVGAFLLNDIKFKLVENQVYLLLSNKHSYVKNTLIMNDTNIINIVNNNIISIDNYKTYIVNYMKWVYTGNNSVVYPSYIDYSFENNYVMREFYVCQYSRGIYELLCMGYFPLKQELKCNSKSYYELFLSCGIDIYGLLYKDGAKIINKLTNNIFCIEKSLYKYTQVNYIKDYVIYDCTIE